MKKLALISLTTLLASVSHASASATVTLGNETFEIDTVTCSGGPGAFSVQAQATTGAQLLQLGAFDGDVKTIGFRVGDTMAQVADQTGTFDGKTFVFDGEAQVYTANSFNRKALKIRASCG
jgi:hypothetical protein